MNSSLTYLGLDIAKRSLDLSPHPAFTQRTFSNDAAGHRALVAALRRVGGSIQILCEATGGYEHQLLAALHEAQVPLTLVNPRPVRDFARAKGLLAKTDALDAAVLAEYGRVFQPAPTAARPPARQRLAQLVSRRQELLGLITQEQHRTEHHHERFVVRQAARLLATLRRHLQQLEEEIAQLEKSDGTFGAQVQRLTTVQGGGPADGLGLVGGPARTGHAPAGTGGGPGRPGSLQS
jgi:transposase